MSKPKHADSAQPKPADPSAPAITAQQAEVLLKADLANLAKRVAAGKTLSAAERNLLQSAFTGGSPTTANFVSTQEELGKAVNRKRKTIQRHLKIPGNPGARADGRYDVNAWRVWFANRTGDDDSVVGAVTQTQAKARQILLQNQKLEVQLAILRRDWVPADSVKEWGADLGAQIRKILLTIPTQAPSIVGLPTADAESRLRDIIDDALRQLHSIGDRLESWKASNEPVG